MTRLFLLALLLATGRHRGPRSRLGNRGSGLLHASGRNRGVQAGTQSRGGAEQLHGLPLGRLRQHPAARAEIQEGFLAGRSDQDDQGLWRADRRCGCRQDRRLSRRDLLKLRREIESMRASVGRGRGLAAVPIRSNWNRRYVLRSFAASNDRETGKSTQMRRDNDRFPPKSRMSFKLSSVPHTAYPAPVGHAGLRGPAVRYRFLIPRRRRDG